MKAAELTALINTIETTLSETQQHFPHDLILKLEQIFAILIPTDLTFLKDKFGLDIPPNIVEVLKKIDAIFTGNPSKAMEVIDVCQRLQRHTFVLRTIAAFT